MRFLACCLAVLVCYYSVEVVQAASIPKAIKCAIPMAIRLTEHGTVFDENGTKEGTVEVCEDNIWKLLCDTDWTQSDAEVACRSLNRSLNSEFFYCQFGHWVGQYLVIGAVIKIYQFKFLTLYIRCPKCYQKFGSKRFSCHDGL